jgi:hypothetical protein
MDLERQRRNFKDHVAEFTDYGNIKILDFKKPGSSEYRIRFLFEEDYCRLHISGDLGELIATNFNNMVFEKFIDFVNDPGYFKTKIDCMSRKLYVFDEEKARDDIKKLIDEYDVLEVFTESRFVPTDIEEAMDDILIDFDSDRGIGSKGYDELSKGFDDVWEIAREIGREDTGIIELYMLAFKLAMEQLKK